MKGLVAFLAFVSVLMLSTGVATGDVDERETLQREFDALEKKASDLEKEIEKISKKQITLFKKLPQDVQCVINTRERSSCMSGKKWTAREAATVETYKEALNEMEEVLGNLDKIYKRIVEVAQRLIVIHPKNKKEII